MGSEVTTVQLRMQRLFAAGGLLGVGLLTGAWAAQRSAKSSVPRVDVAVGRQVFERHCALCHGMDGKGGRGPALNRAHLAHAPDEESLKAVIQYGIPPNMPEGYFLDEKDITNLAAFVKSLSAVPADKLPGDAERGASVYAKSGCGNCHVLNGAGQGYGPELTGIGERRSASFLEQTIRKPSATLPEDFLLVKVTTASGEAIEGIRANEDTFTIQIKDSGGQFHSLRVGDLREFRKLRGESPMPAFEGILGATEMQDLVAYLASQRGKS